ncbi:hypothetical protein BGZ81_009258 [Podila clonocystis]|nr:hypothetical protein BGZ81_009258 [Podila clonocystis]
MTNTDYLVVVVTGCDTGFGAETVEDLYQCGGFTIHATCLTEATVSKYNTCDSTRLRSLKADVIKQEDVDRQQNNLKPSALKKCIVPPTTFHHLPGLSDGRRLRLRLEIDICISNPGTPTTLLIGPTLVKGWTNADEATRQMYDPGFNDALNKGTPAIRSLVMPSK